MATPSFSLPLSLEQIIALIPHRYPMLLIDRVLELVPNQRAVALKNVTINEGFFAGHFPGHPIMPGVLIVEAMAQAAAVIVGAGFSAEELPNKLIYFMSIESARFRKPVVPGDSLLLKVNLLQRRGKVCVIEGEAEVDGTTVANAKFMAMTMDRKG